ncbi:concanavalin A-like lectin/glucanase, partial [Apodospora peruviana]
MAPSFTKLGAAALACAVGVSAAAESYLLSDSYNSENFFSQWDYFVSNFETGEVDPTHGFVNYQSASEAKRLGLTAVQGEEVFIGVDHATNGTGLGRSSVRIESKNRYNSGLFIAKFTHLPKPTCGAWPAFWMYGPNWPAGGEVDIYEMWNHATANLITLHTGDPDEVGVCTVDQTEFSAFVETSNCDNEALGQFSNQGCGAREYNGQWGSETGGVYATEWQEDVIRVWSWPHNGEPADIVEGKPDPSTWGKPHFSVDDSSCAIKTAFHDMRLVMDITFCGDAAGNPGIWGQTCATSTGEAVCADYVDKNPDDFKDVFWKISYINVYQ